MVIIPRNKQLAECPGHVAGEVDAAMSSLNLALEDLRADHDRTGNPPSLIDVIRTAERHGLTAESAAMLQILAEAEEILPPQAEGAAVPELRAKRGESLDSLDAWFREASQFPLLLPPEVIQLCREREAGVAAEEALRRVAGESSGVIERLNSTVARGRAARDRLILSNLRLVASIAALYGSDGMERTDLLQEGVFGLMRAVELFNWRLGFMFSTYASHWIRQAVTRSLDNQGKLIRLPVHIQVELRKIKRESRKLEDLLNRPPTLQELAERTGVELSRLAFLIDVPRVLSLDSSGDDGDEQSLLAVLHSSEPTPDEMIEQLGTLEELADVLALLAPRERQIIEMRFGLDGNSPMSLEAIGCQFGLTRERIRQLQNLSLGRLREAMLKDPER